ncbi:hypothetical protein [Nostoc punctiforme]|jgi:hypothetical protein|nr:hypothetical protein [Nostoc punctiforme]
MSERYIAIFEKSEIMAFSIDLPLLCQNSWLFVIPVLMKHQ